MLALDDRDRSSIQNGEAGVKPFFRRLKSLIAFGDVRIMQILESLQYGIIYFILGFMIGTMLDTLFPIFDEDAPVEDVITQTILQSVAIIVAVFYTKNIAKLIPFLFVLIWDLDGDGKIASYKPYTTSEYDGSIIIGLVLIGSQSNFRRKIDLLTREVYRRYMGGETRARSLF